MSSLPPAFSIIVPVYRDSEPVACLLASLAKQQCSYPYEVLFVDDGSHPDDRTRIEHVIKASGLPQARFLGLPQNGGPAVARNAGVADARADVLVFIDSDCELIRADHLQALYEAHLERPDSILGGALQGYGRGYVAFADNYCHWSTNIPTGRLQEVREGHLVTAHLIFLRTVWDKAGPLNVELRTGEDTAFSMRARKMGIGLWLHGALVLRHHDRESLSAFCRCFYEVGRDRRAVRLIALGQAPVFLGTSWWLRLLFAPLVVAGLTLKMLGAWWPHDKRVLLATPGIVLASLCMSLGVIRGR